MRGVNRIGMVAAMNAVPVTSFNHECLEGVALLESGWNPGDEVVLLTAAEKFRSTTDEAGDADQESASDLDVGEPTDDDISEDDSSQELDFSES